MIINMCLPLQLDTTKAQRYFGAHSAALGPEGCIHRRRTGESDTALSPRQLSHTFLPRREPLATRGAA